MKAKAMCIKRICIAFFDAAEDSAAISCYAKSFSGQWAEMTVLQMRGGTVCRRRQILQEDSFL